MDPAMNYQSINMPTNASSEDHSRRAVGLVLSSLPRAPTGSEGRVASTASDAHSRHLAVSPQSFTARSLLVGILIGVLITFSNTYFGLQTGWISTMAMPSALIGFSVFKVFSKHLSYPFTPIENVLIQTVAGAVGTMPLGCGFVGVIPAMEFLLRKGDDGPSGDGGTGEGGPLKLNVWKLMLWSLGVCLFGVVFAVPLRKETIIREKLKFPSGTASALMLRVLHGKGHEVPVAGGVRHSDSDLQEVEAPPPPYDTDESGPLLKDVIEDHAEKDDWRFKMRLLIGAFVVSGVYTLFSYFVPQVRAIPIFGASLAHNWLWTLNPSPAYIGQGIIMGPSTCMHMLFGAVLGWGVLSPLAKARGWAPGDVDNWEDGSKAWIVWVSLAIMLADSIISLGWLVARPLIRQASRLGRWATLTKSSYIGYSALNPALDGSDQPGNEGQMVREQDDSDSEEDAPPSQLVSARTVAILLPLTLVLNIICMHIVFGDIISPLLSSLATLLAVLLSIMGVRALGETDLNPVSGISKLTQLLFSVATPASHFSRRTAVVTNLLAGAVSEAGALQAGDLMQDLKTGHILGASPKAQFYGQIIGSLVGAVFSTVVYKMYVNVYEVPGPMFQTPTAYVWIFTARLVTGQGLPEMAWPVSLGAGAIFVITTILRIVASSPVANSGRPGVTAPWKAWIPGGIAVAVGIYNEPSFTLARAIGGLIAWWWSRRYTSSHRPQISHSLDAASDRDRNLMTEHQPPSASGHTPIPRNQGQTVDRADIASSSVVILASGLILGEGIISIINLLLASGRVPHL